MSVGTSIFFFAVGAVLYFAVNTQISGIDIKDVGLIVMVASAIAFVVSLALTMRRRRSVSRVETTPGGGYEVERESTPRPL